MKKVGNTLYVISPGTYLSLEGETVLIDREKQETCRIPLPNLKRIVASGCGGASPALIRACAQRRIEISFTNGSWRFLARGYGDLKGNILLRKEQYRHSDDLSTSMELARLFLSGKLYNSRQAVERAIREDPFCRNTKALSAAARGMAECLSAVKQANSPDELLGLKEKAEDCYFSIFGDLILQQKEDFRFTGRNRRPPQDRVNALLSFLYTLLAHDVCAALNTAGLDPYVGFLHRDHPGRISLALDLMEELRSVLADRLALFLINTRRVTEASFVLKENGTVLITDEGKQVILTAWQEKKKEILMHPFLEEKMEWGMVPFTQSLLLARYLRGELDAYPPFLWK